MASNNNANTGRSWKRLFSLASIASILTAASLITAVFFGLIAIQTDTTELTVEVISSEELTLPTTAEGLIGKYTYRNEEVEHLWRVRLDFTNTGTQSIIGQGPSSNLLYGDITFEFPSDTEILESKVEVDETGSVITIAAGNTFKLNFDQVRSRETIIISFFVSAEQIYEQFPYISVMGRPIIDGEVLITTSVEKKVESRTSLLDNFNLPHALGVGIRLTGLIFIALMVLLSGLFLIMTLPSYYKRTKWLRSHPKEQYTGNIVTTTLRSSIIVIIIALFLIVLFILIILDLLPL